MEEVKEFSGHSQNKAFPLSKLPPEILDHIFGFCAVVDLKCCRLVSKMWCSSALKSWQGRAIVKLNASHENTGKPIRTISEFLEFLEKAARQSNEIEHLYVNFSLKLITSKEENNLFQAFLRKWGQHIKMLKLDNCSFNSLNDFQNTIFGYCPNMRELIIAHSNAPDPTEAGANLEQTECEKNRNLKVLEIESRNMNGFAVIPWIEYFTNFPSITTLKVKGNDKTMNEIFTLISDIKLKEPKQLKLESIEIENYEQWSFTNFNVSLLKVLKDETIHLKKLSIQLHISNAEAILHDVLQSQGTCLKRLELRITGNVGLNVSNCFPLEMERLFENLSELHLQGPVFQDLTYLEFMPFLKKLVIRKYSERELLKFPDTSNIKLVKMIELEIEHYLKEKELGKLIEWMPNVERLRIPLNNDTFELVCKHWKNLTMLDITTSLVDECGLTGLNPDHVKLVNESDGNCQLELGNAKENISSLNHLRRLSMCKGFNLTLSTSRLNFASVLFGFWKASSLETVHVLDYEVNEELWKRITKPEISEVCGKSFKEYTLLNKTQTRFGKTEEQ